MAATSGRPVDFVLRPLRKPEEFRHAEELQRDALGPEPDPVVPAAMLRVILDTGGIVLGAFADIHLAGLTVASLGWDGTSLYQQAHVTVVRSEYRNHRLGYRLLGLLREEVLRLGLGEIRWSFDPLQRTAAALSLRRLGARVDGFLPNYFGQLTLADRATDESDRLRARWLLSDAVVERRLGGALPAAEEDRRRLAAAAALIETEVGEKGLRLPSVVAEPTGPEAHLEVPFDLASIRAHEPGAVRRWRHAARDAFRAALDLGYVVDDFTSVAQEHERRSFYLFRSGTPGPSNGPGPTGLREPEASPGARG